MQIWNRGFIFVEMLIEPLFFSMVFYKWLYCVFCVKIANLTVNNANDVTSWKIKSLSFCNFILIEDLKQMK